MNSLLKSLENKLVVSCQAEGDDPFNSPEGVALFAKAAIMGGCAGIRTEGLAKTEEIRKQVSVPVIGLVKSYFEDGFVRITGSMEDVRGLISAGADIVAIDGTFRFRENLSGPDFIRKVKRETKCTVMADIATVEEGIACADAGADCLSTTLSGYTPETKEFSSKSPDFDLLVNLLKEVSVPVFAEGRINTPGDAAKMISLGAWGVVVGTVITRPRVVTQWFAEAVERSKGNK